MTECRRRRRHSASWSKTWLSINSPSGRPCNFRLVLAKTAGERVSTRLSGSSRKQGTCFNTGSRARSTGTSASFGRTRSSADSSSPPSIKDDGWKLAAPNLVRRPASHVERPQHGYEHAFEARQQDGGERARCRH